MPNLSIDEGVFSNYGEEAEYWCGILATEGNVYFPGGDTAPRIQYGAVDVKHVYKFRSFLKSEHKIAIRDWQRNKRISTAAVIGFTSHVIAEFLVQNGITPKKSLTLKVSDRLASSPHFWRGAIDGDGSISIAKRYAQPGVMFTSGSFEFIKQFADFCANIGLRPKISNFHGADGSYNKAPHYRVGFGSGQAIQLLKFLFTDATVWLDRKKVTVDQIFAQPIRQKRVYKVEKVAGVRIHLDAIN